MSLIKGYRFEVTGWIKVEGEDAWDYLQSQFSNDLKSVNEGKVVYGFFLDRKGKVLLDAFIWREAEEVYRVFSYFCEGGAMLEQLESNIVADDVEMILGSVLCSAIWGESVKALGLSLPESGGVVIKEDSVILKGRHSGDVNYDIICDESVGELEGVEWVDESEFHAERIQSGIAAVPQDLGSGDFPNEAGVATEGVAYNKGCYLGQEVMMRLHTMGKAQRSLYRVELDEVYEGLPKDIFKEGKKVGELRSCAGLGGKAIGLAMLKNRALEGVEGFEVESSGSLKIIGKAGKDD